LNRASILSNFIFFLYRASPTKGLTGVGCCGSKSPIEQLLNERPDSNSVAIQSGLVLGASLSPDESSKAVFVALNEKRTSFCLFKYKNNKQTKTNKP
jgi:hypothetical protein